MNFCFAARSFRRLNFRITKLVALAFVLLLAVASALICVNRSSAAGGDIDPIFNPGGSGANGFVHVVAVQPDGKILIGGEFTSYNGDAAANDRIMRLNADGTRDTTFNVGGTGANDTVYAIAVQTDGKILIGGQVSSYNGAMSSHGIMRLNADGTRDTTFNAGGTGTNETVNAVTLQPDGKIIIGGFFTAYNTDATASDYIMRLNADGTRDTTFNSGGAGANDFAAAVAVQSDGKIVVGGNFTSYNGDAAASDKIMRLNADGTRDTAFNSGGAGANDTVRAVALQPDGKIIVGGLFTSYNGEAAANDKIMRLNADGTRDTAFNSGGTGASFAVFSLVLQTDGKIVIGGNLSSYNGLPASNHIMRLNRDGTRDTTFNAGGAGANSSVHGVALQPDGKIIIGGQFTGYNGDAAAPDRVIRLLPAPGAIAYSSNTYDVTENAGNATITLKRTGGTDNQVVGKVTLTDVTTSPADYRFTPGARDAAFNAGGTGAGASGAIHDVAVQPDGKIIIGGSFDIYNGDAAASDEIMRLNADGTRDTTFNAGGAGANSSVLGVALQPDGKIIIGGQFTSYNGDAAASDRIMRLNVDGTRDTTFNSGGAGASGSIDGVAVQPDGKIIIGGQFTSYNGDAAASDGVMRLNADGTRDTTFNAGGSGTDFSVFDVAVQPDGKIIIGGNFTIYNGDAAASDQIMRLNADGTRDVTFNPGGSGADASVGAIAVQPDGKIVIAGDLTTYNGDAASPDYIMRLKVDGTRDTTFNPGGAGADSFMFALELQPNGKIIIGGIFLSYNGDAAANNKVMRLDGDLFVTWPAGDATDKIVQLPIVNDGISEGTETLTLGLSLMSGGAMLGSPSLATLAIHDPNTPPTITAAGPLTRQQGSAASNSQISAVNDSESGAGGVTVTVTSANPANGVTVSNIANSSGTVTANLVAACTASNASFTLTATDGNGATANATLNVTVTANTAPTLSYATPQSVAFNASLKVTPTAASDNGSITGSSVISVSPPLTTAPTVNSSGVVAITSAQPAGAHTITIRATDNCGATTDANFVLNVGATPTPTPTPPPNAVQFGSATYNITEDCTAVTITVNRLGDTSGAVTVDYTTSDVTASERRDYITAIGKLRFAAGETSKTFAVLINEDSYVEGNETFTVSLSNPTGSGLGAPAIATVTITDDAAEPATNAIDEAQNFVCEQYHDFLNRQPDASGLAFWTNEIASCGANQSCVELKRINVSAAFFLSIEFQETGYLVERMYKAAYGNANGTSTFGGSHQLQVPIVRFNEFLPDTQEIGNGVVVGAPGWEAVLENNKQAFANNFVQRSRFTTAFPTTMSPAQFVDALNANAGNVLSGSERTAAINLFAGAGNTTNLTARAQALRQVAEDQDLSVAEFNRAFVLMQFIGYLRRNPNEPPDSDYTGYDFWLAKLNQFNGNFINAEMVKAFLFSIEYRQRFGQ